MYSVLSFTLLSAIFGLCVAPLVVALITVGCAGKPIQTGKKQGAIRRDEKASNKLSQGSDRIAVPSIIKIKTGKKERDSEVKERNNANEKLDSIALSSLIEIQTGKRQGVSDEKESDKASEESDRIALPSLIQALETDDAVKATPAFDRLDDITRNRPLLLLPHLHAVISLYCKIVCNTEKEQRYRTSALDLLVLLCNDENSGMVKEHTPQKIADILSSCLQLMSEVREPDSNWFERGFMTGETAANGASLSLDYIVRNLDKDGGDFSSLALLKLAKELMQSDDWRRRYAGLTGVTQIKVGNQPLKPETETVIIDVVDNINRCLTDKHPRVVRSACHTIKVLAYTLSPLLQDKCYQSIIPSLLSILTGSSIHHIALLAAETFDAFLNSCSKSATCAYLNAMVPVFEKIFFELYENTRITEKSEEKFTMIIRLISSLAKNVPDHMTNIYDKLMKPLKSILKERPEKDQAVIDTNIGGEALHCITMLAVAEGMTKFSSDCSEVMQTIFANLLPLLRTHKKFAVDMGDLAKLLAADFNRFLPSLVPILCDSIDGRGDQCESRNIRMRNVKCLLVILPKELGGSFAPYVNQVMDMAIRDLLEVIWAECNCCWTERLNCAWAMESAPFLLAAIKSEGMERMRGLWLQYWNAIKKMSKDCNEHDGPLSPNYKWRGQRAEGIASIGAAMQVLGPKGVTTDELKEIGRFFLTETEACDKRRVEINEKNSIKHKLEMDREEQKETYDEAVKEEETIIKSLVSTTAAITKTVGSSFSREVDILVPLLSSLVEKSTNDQWKSSVLADLNILKADVHKQPLPL